MSIYISLGVSLSLEWAFKFMVNWHHEYVAWLIDQVVQQKIPNLVINVPPSAGKTELLQQTYWLVG